MPPVGLDKNNSTQMLNIFYYVKLNYDYLAYSSESCFKCYCIDKFIPVYNKKKKIFIHQLILGSYVTIKVVIRLSLLPKVMLFIFAIPEKLAAFLLVFPINDIAVVLLKLKSIIRDFVSSYGNAA